MSHKIRFTAALVSFGIMSSASATVTNEVHITGSPAFRGFFFNAATAASGGIFASPGGTPSAGPNANIITYTGIIGGVPYALECSFTSSEAGLRNIDGGIAIPNPGLPNLFEPIAAGLPGVITTFPKIDGSTVGGFTGVGDLTLSDTCQNISLTTPPAFPALFDYGIVGVVTFVWEKGKNSTGNPASSNAGDAAWARLVNVTERQMVVALGSTLEANLFTADTNDSSTPVLVIGNNAGSGTRDNALIATQYSIIPSVNQFALNSTYNAADVLNYNIVANNQAATYPSVLSCEANQANDTQFPDLLGVGNDGYDNGAGVSDCLSCDCSGSGCITLGYLGIDDAKHARDGQAANGAMPAQPGGAVFMTLSGTSYSDAAVVNGTYTFWGYEHLYGNGNHTAIINNAAAAIESAIPAVGGLGTGSAGAQSSGIVYADMLVEKFDCDADPYPSPV